MMGPEKEQNQELVSSLVYELAGDPRVVASLSPERLSELQKEALELLEQQSNKEQPETDD